jgi:hypothetical protein
MSTKLFENEGDNTLGTQTTPTMTKSLLKDKILPDLKQRGDYFSYDEVKAHLETESEQAVPASTLKTYLSQLTHDGILFDAGKGWYSRLSKPLELDSKPLDKIVGLLANDFPLLDVSCWSTEQINPYMHHLLSRFVTLVYTASDAMEVVGDALQDAGFNVLVNPKKLDIEKYYTKMDSPVVIRPAVSKEPDATAGIAPAEKLLVDLLYENRKLMIMETSEAADVVKKSIAAGRVNMAALQSYYMRREMGSGEQFVNQLRNNNTSGVGR